MVIIDGSPSKVSDYPVLAATLERYKTLGKKKRGRPKKVSTALKPNLKVAMPSLLLNPNCDLGLFWDVFHEAASEEYRGSLPSRFNEWQQTVDRIERAAEEERDLAIKLANQQYENTLAQEVQPAQAELDQMKHLADAVDNMLPKEKLAEFFRQVAKQKAKGGHWRKKLQLRMGPQYKDWSFYGALSQWIKDRYGMDKKPDAIRKAIDREYELLM